MKQLAIVLALAFVLSGCGAVATSTSAPRPTTTLESLSFQPPTEVPTISTITATATLALTSTQTTTPLPTAIIVWVCTDLAYGREKPQSDAPVVFQMSQQDRWMLTVRQKAGEWYEVESNGVVAWMLASDLSPGAPPTATATPVPTSTPVPTPTSRPLPTATTAPPPTISAPSSGVRVGAVCRDGTTSSATGSGACSHHGGVARWIYR